MPNQDDQNNNQSPQNLDPVMDLPPMMDNASIPQTTSSNLGGTADQKTAFAETVVEEQTQDPKDELSATLNEDPSNSPKGGSAAPSGVDSDVDPIISTAPKKKFGGGKIIATILGVLMLVGGIGGGVYLTQQQQDIREKAGGSVCDNGTAAQKAAAGCGSNCPSGSYSCTRGCCAVFTGETVSQGNNGNTSGSNTSGNNNSGQSTATTTCGTTWNPNDVCSGVQVITAYPTLSQGQQAKCQNGRCQVYDAAGNRVGGEYRLSGGNNDGTDTPPPVATTPPSATASCQNIKAYSEAFTEEITNVNLSKLAVGSKVNLCVSGTTTAGSFTKAKFTINTVAQTETTTKRPSSNDFCQLYTIPAGTTAFNITAQIFHSTLGWK